MREQRNVTQGFLGISIAILSVFAAGQTFSSQAFAFGAAPVHAQPGPVPNGSQDGGPYYRQGNLTFDLTYVHDADLRLQILSALALGFQQALAGKAHIGKEIADLRGDGQPRVIRFYSDEAEENPGGVPIGAPAAATWIGPAGRNDMDSPPSTRTDLRILMTPGQPYWYLVNSVWHELLHTTLNITHHQTTPEGTMPADHVNDAVWYETIQGIMLDFPRWATDPVTGQSTELYNPENNPWS